jgi:hypothetical protein
MIPTMRQLEALVLVYRDGSPGRRSSAAAVEFIKEPHQMISIL